MKTEVEVLPYRIPQSKDNGYFAFRKWLSDHGCIVHPSVCIVNGEATDGTKNAPVLIFENPSHSTNNLNNSMSQSNSSSSSNQTLHPNHTSSQNDTHPPP